MSLRNQKSVPNFQRNMLGVARPAYQAKADIERGVTQIRARANTVLERMQKTGWAGVVAQDSEASPTGLIKRGSADSGFSEGSQTSSQDKNMYLENWGKLKKAVWGDEESEDHGRSFTPTASLAGSALWDKLLVATAAMSSSVAESVARARGEEDDDTVGPDGETKLSRVIKEYHVSRANSTADLPKWLFSARELTARSTASSRSALRSQTREYEDEPRYTSRHKQSTSSSPSYTRTNVANAPEFGYNNLPRSKAADRLRAMREAKRGCQ